MNRFDKRSGTRVPLITIAIVVRNRVADLPNALESVKKQAFDDFELLVIDGGSTDGTVDLLRAESRVDFWLSEPDRGIYDAMNKAVRAARGRWVYFLGSDDVLRDILPHASAYLKDPRSIYYGNVYRKGTKKIYDGKFGPWKLLRRNICQQAIFYPRSVFEHHQFSLQYHLLADWEFNLRCYADPRYSFSYIPLTVADYDDISGASSIVRDERFAEDQAKIIRDCLPYPCYLWHLVKKTAHAILGHQKAVA